MELKFFSVAAIDEAAVQELNKFLRSHKVIGVSEQWSEKLCSWVICVRYLGKEQPELPASRVDYRKELDSEAFKKFSAYRDVRKAISEEDQVPAYLVFTNAELAELAKVSELSLDAMGSVPGIGEKRMAQYGKRFIDKLGGRNEAAGLPD